MPQEALDRLCDLLDLESIEVNIFRGRSPDEDRQRVFGGQVAGQALVAASRTLDDPERSVHSLHAYFLRPGDPTVPILYDVDRIRDGRSFTTRRVVAIQRGRAIFNLAASFHRPEPGLDHQIPLEEAMWDGELPPDPESLPDFAARMERFRDRLGEHLDLYQIHSATIESGVLDDDAVLDELARLRQSGLSIGVSVSGARQPDSIRRALEVERDGQRLFSTVQATWNLLERSAEDALDEAHRMGVRVIVKEALANGTLTERSADIALAPRLDVLRTEAGRFGLGMDAVALAAAVNRPWADLVLSGAVTPDQLRSNVDALDCPWDDASEARLGGLTLDTHEYWAKRAKLPWT